VHADGVLVVDGAWSGPVPEADGLVVTAPGTAAGVRAADCMPLLLGDGERGLAAAVHVGRAGLQADIVAVAVDQLARLGATSLVARIGRSTSTMPWSKSMNIARSAITHCSPIRTC